MAVKGLEYVINLTDKMSPKVGKLTKTVENFTAKTKAAMGNIAMGAAGLFAVGASMKAALMPAIEMDRALGETASLGVADEALEKLRKTALNFSIEYGKNAVDVVRSSYEIKQAFGNITPDELVGLTKTTNILAAAIKTDANSAKNYISRMFSLYENEANAMGKVKWAEQLSSQTAIAVQLFKTDAGMLENAFKTIGSTAKAAGISTAEQFAVIGQLQGKVGETKAAKQYEAFIKGAVSAQKAMGLSFTDSNGKLLAADQILAKIRKRFGDVTKHKDAIKKAFGGEPAYKFIENLVNESDSLHANIEKLGDVKGIDDVSRMAHKMTDPWERLEALITAVASSIGSALQPVFYPVLNSIIDIGGAFVDWLNTYRNIARWIGYLITGLFGITATGPAFMLFKGIFMMWGGSIKLTWSILKGLTTGVLTLGRTAIKVALGKLKVLIRVLVILGRTAITLTWTIFKNLIKSLFMLGSAAIKLAWFAVKGFTRAIFQNVIVTKLWAATLWVLNGVMKAIQIGARLMWAAMTGPIGLIVAAIAVVGYVVYTNWEKIKGWGKALWQSIKSGWQSVVDFFGNISPMKAFQKLGDSLGTIFTNAYNGLKNDLISVINWVIEKLNKLPGINIDLIQKSSVGGAPLAQQSSALLGAATSIATTLPPLPSAVKPTGEIKSGVLNKTTNNQNTQNTTYNINVAKVESNNPAEFTQMMHDQAALAY